MNRNNQITSALRTQLGSQTCNGLKRETDHTENVQLEGVIPCTFISKVLEIEICRQLEGLKYDL